jgi:hypothetical protein
VGLQALVGVGLQALVGVELQAVDLGVGLQALVGVWLQTLSGGGAASLLKYADGVILSLKVHIESQLDAETSSFSMPGMGVVTIPVEPTSPTTQGIMLGTKREHPDSIP